MSAAAAGAPQLQHVRTLRGHAGRVRTVMWLGSHEAAAGDTAPTDSNSSAGSSGGSRGGSGLGTILSGSEDQTVRAWTLDTLASAPAAAEPMVQQEAAGAGVCDATAADHASDQIERQQGAHQSGEADAVLLAGSGTAAAVEAPAAAPAAAAETEPSTPGQRPAAPPPEATLQRSPSLCDGMSGDSGAELQPDAAEKSSMQQHPQQQQTSASEGAERNEQQGLQSASSPRTASGSGELETLSTVAAASPGRLRYGGLPPPPSQPPLQGLSIASSASGPHIPPADEQQPAAVQQPQQGSASALPAAGPAAGAAVSPPVSNPSASGSAAASTADGNPSVPAPPAAGGGRRGRQAKAASLGARPLPLPVQSPKAAAAQLLQPGVRDSALAACLQVSRWQRAGLPEAPDAEPAGSAAAAGGDSEASLAAAEQLRSWGVFAGPLDAGAALQAAASAALEVQIEILLHHPAGFTEHPGKTCITWQCSGGSIPCTARSCPGFHQLLQFLPPAPVYSESIAPTAQARGSVLTYFRL